jgi:chromate transport protein ChrA
VLLRNYSKQIGRTKFWTLAILPLAAMLIGAVFIFGAFGSSTVLFRATISGAAFYAASILFAILFLTVARNANKSNHKTVAHHLTVCAIGIVIFWRQALALLVTSLTGFMFLTRHSFSSLRIS